MVCQTLSPINNSREMVRGVVNRVGGRVISENEEVCLARKGVVSEEGDFNEEGAWSERMELR